MAKVQPVSLAIRKEATLGGGVGSPRTGTPANPGSNVDRDTVLGMQGRMAG
jgi:hypothetical protein